MRSVIASVLSATLFAGAAIADCGSVSSINPYLASQGSYLQAQLDNGAWTRATFTEYSSLGRWNEIGISRKESDGKDHKINMALEPVNVATISATGKQIAPAVQAILNNCAASNRLDNAWEWVNSERTLKVYISAEY